MVLNPASVVPAVMGGFILLFGLASMFIKERLFLSEALVATIFGIIIGPVGLNLIDPNTWGVHPHTFTMEFARIVIALQVMAAGVNLPKKYILREWKSFLIFLFPVMAVMWLVAAAVFYWLLPLSFLESLLLAACITPTDPVLANSIVQGGFAERYVPVHLRDIIAAESGANDGLGFPFLFFAFLMLRSNSPGQAIGQWLITIWGYQIALSILIGFVAGFAARRLLHLCERKHLIDKESFLVFSIALAVFLMGTVTMIHSDDLLAVFVAGTTFTWDAWFRKKTKEAHLQEVIDMMFNVSFFVYFGTIIPWSTFGSASLNLSVLRLVGITSSILIFRRIPVVLLLYRFIPAVKNYREAIFAGWFGPVGVGGLFYCMISLEEMKEAGPKGYLTEIIFPVISFLVLSSVIVHGITVPLFHLGSIGTRTLTTSNTIASLVSRLPVIRPGQEIVIARTAPVMIHSEGSQNTLCSKTTESKPPGYDGKETSGLDNGKAVLGKVISVREYDDVAHPLGLKSNRKSLVVIEHVVDVEENEVDAEAYEESTIALRSSGNSLDLDPDPTAVQQVRILMDNTKEKP
ncbi:hypothetical protein K493DRAFT_284366 [Basidiobolus meristosporus CBS 931.73]|uniref:Cation/H+ exchanger transmembrane domain-containing protein n=1 Tax=Basidiobolus meristosporus CBS 931.73 TaxID=1314790 RepID=A0A1Y1Y7W0_9FUNG|nr:hypothetical protein K493DRAFT_284366 [Basidiobolus meristosporus CBS 931.73]|eukprot:ORX93816.1 hypothetical protein K493DRAFT_284366 [Basidiobolus meristosporus CBS 931.73]